MKGDWLDYAKSSSVAVLRSRIVVFTRVGDSFFHGGAGTSIANACSGSREQLSGCRRFRLNGVTTPKPQKGQQEPEALKGWKKISEFLGEPVTVVKRWAADGMSLHREGQFVFTSSNELNAWLGQESGKPVHVATENTDLTAELKRGLSFVRSEKTDRPR